MAATRKIITIDEEKCDGCGLCIPNCPEGALRIIDGKARLVGDLFCDGLGACIGHCPRNAIRIEERRAEPYDERRVMENIVRQGENVLRAHLEHLRQHGAVGLFRQAVEFLEERGLEVPEGVARPGEPGEPAAAGGAPPRREAVPAASRLRHWPVQMRLVPAGAPWLAGADLLVAADCVPFAYAGFHEDLLAGRVLLVGCPKLDDADYYRQKLAEIFRGGRPRSVTCAHMEVPCCYGMAGLVRRALEEAGVELPLEEVTVSVRGERLEGGA